MSKPSKQEVKEMFLNGELSAKEAAKITDLSPMTYYGYRNKPKVRVRKKDKAVDLKDYDYEKPLTVTYDGKNWDAEYGDKVLLKESYTEEEFQKLNRKYTKLMEYVKELLDDQ